MTIGSSVSLRNIAAKYLIVTVATLLLGMFLGIGQLYAESKTVNVPGIGNVGTAETVGTASGGTYGRSMSTTTLWHIRAHIKIWHTGNILQAQDNKVWWNSTGFWTNNISSIGHGDYSVTLHKFKYTSATSGDATVYTSMDGAWSCSSAWNHYVSYGSC